jgi:hypothetical protein
LAATGPWGTRIMGGAGGGLSGFGVQAAIVIAAAMAQKRGQELIMKRKQPGIGQSFDART